MWKKAHAHIYMYVFDQKYTQMLVGRNYMLNGVGNEIDWRTSIIDRIVSQLFLYTMQGERRLFHVDNHD